MFLHFLAYRKEKLMKCYIHCGVCVALLLVSVPMCSSPWRQESESTLFSLQSSALQHDCLHCVRFLLLRWLQAVFLEIYEVFLAQKVVTSLPICWSYCLYEWKVVLQRKSGAGWRQFLLSPLALCFALVLHRSGIYIATPVSAVLFSFPFPRVLCERLSEEEELKHGARKIRVSANIVPGRVSFAASLTVTGWNVP